MRLAFEFRSGSKKLGIFAGSLCASLLIAELVLRIAGFRPAFANPERGVYWEYDHTLGWAHRPGQTGRLSKPQFATSIRINKKGLRDQDHTYKRQGAKKRILVLGDSFAWGFGVEEHERFSEVLEAAMDIEVINAGVSGYSTDQELLWLRREGVKYEFDLIVLCFCGNDKSQNHQHRVYYRYHKPVFALANGKLAMSNVPVPRISLADHCIYSARRRSSLANLFANRLAVLDDRFSKSVGHQAEPPISGNERREPFALTRRLVSEIKDIANAQGATFMVVSTRTWWRTSSDGPFDRFIDCLKTDGLLVLDVESCDAFDYRTMVIRGDGHWNPAGHRFVAERIRNMIDSEGLLLQVSNVYMSP